MIASHAVSSNAASRTAAPTERIEPFQIKGTAFKIMVLKIVDPSNPELFIKLGDMIRQAPTFFGRAPIVLDFGDLPAELVDIAPLVARIRALSLMPCGVVATSVDIQKAAQKIGLPVMP